jgi:hypothetical protein
MNAYYAELELESIIIKQEDRLFTINIRILQRMFRGQ